MFILIFYLKLFHSNKCLMLQKLRLQIWDGTLSSIQNRLNIFRLNQPLKMGVPVYGAFSSSVTEEKPGDRTFKDASAHIDSFRFKENGLGITGAQFEGAEL